MPPGDLEWDSPGPREAMLGVASGLVGGVPESLDGSRVETDAEGEQLMMAVTAARAERGLAWVSLGLCRASAGTGSGVVGTTAAGKKVSRLSLRCLGVVGVSPEACEDRGEVRAAGTGGSKLIGSLMYTSLTGYVIWTQGANTTLNVSLQAAQCCQQYPEAFCQDMADASTQVGTPASLSRRHPACD